MMIFAIEAAIDDGSRFDGLVYARAQPRRGEPRRWLTKRP
jgi:hypothetical protein